MWVLSTVSHVSNILGTLGASTRTEAAAIVRRKGILRPGGGAIARFASGRLG